MEEYIKIGTTSQIIMESDKAVCLPFGRTFSGELITTWFPKSVICKRRILGEVVLFAPSWVKRHRSCTIGDPNAAIPTGMEPYDGSSY